MLEKSYAQSKIQLIPSWISGLRIEHRVTEDEGSITGLGQWVKDPALPQTVV